MQKTLSLKPRLAGNPKPTPAFATTVQLNSADALQVADPRATRAMVALMDMAALQGGAASHFGGPSAFAELMSAVHGLMFYDAQKSTRPWYELYNFVNDAGHCENGLYALKANYGFADLTIEALKKFRSVDSFLTGHGEAHLFPQGVLISNGPLGSSLPQAQGLACGDALTGNRRVTVVALSDGAAMEGEAKEAFAAIPGMARKGRMAPFVCIVSDNKTKLSGRIESDAFSMEPTFSSLEKLGWHVVRLEDGHSLQACVSTIEESIARVKQDPSVPVLIHAKTVKGKGNKKAEASQTGAHGFPLKKAEELPEFLKELYGSSAVPAPFMAWAEELIQNEKRPKPESLSGGVKLPEYFGPSEKMQAGVAKAMSRHRKAGLPIISVTADLQGSTGIAEFQKEFPEATIDVGVAEANMISTAAGLSLSGFIPFVDTFAQFGVTKGALPITMANLSNAPVIAVFSHTGFQDAADGASHQALSFISQVSSIPHVDVYAMSSSSETEALISQAIEKFAKAREEGRAANTQIFFLGRENFPRRFVPESYTYELGRAQVVRTSQEMKPKSVTIVTCGPLVGEAYAASAALEHKGISSIVVNASAINRPDLATIKDALAKTDGRLVTVEDHRVVGGMGALLTHALLQDGVSLKVRSLGIGDAFGQSAYGAADLYRKHKLDAMAIEAAAVALLG